MSEYKKWLEKQIEDTNESLEKNVNLKCYDAANYYNTKLIVYKDCLDTLKQLERHQGQAVSFNDLEVGKRYVSVYITGGKSMVFAVTAKGCDDEGQYIWYGDTMEDTISFKGYACEYETVEYFEEVE